MIRKLIEKIFGKRKEKEQKIIPKKDFKKDVLEPFFSLLDKQYVSQSLTIYDKNFTLDTDKLIKQFKNIAIITDKNIDYYIKNTEKKYGILIEKRPYNIGIVIDMDKEYINIP